MSEAPSWLSEENISTASKVAQNPAAQNAAATAAKSQAPGWGDVESGPAKPDKPKKSASSPRGASALTKEDVELDIDPVELENMKKYHLALRLLYMGSAVFMATAGALSLQSQSDLGLAFFAFYVMFFSAMICCFEVGMNAISRLIAVNFGFMYTFWGRLIFLILVGFMAFLLSVLGKVAMGVLFATCLFHFFVMWKFPRFEEYLRKKHYYEGAQATKRFEEAERAAAKGRK
mmetsp:Transcript_32732/g.55187  ORF Transcript_32732/g.55187 Transcript_32732/m.55187 type:complete len:232 (+) Transcript_32732:40-735(+)